MSPSTGVIPLAVGLFLGWLGSTEPNPGLDSPFVSKRGLYIGLGSVLVAIGLYLVFPLTHIPRLAVGTILLLSAGVAYALSTVKHAAPALDSAHFNYNYTWRVIATVLAGAGLSLVWLGLVALLKSSGKEYNRRG